MKTVRIKLEEGQSILLTAPCVDIQADRFVVSYREVVRLGRDRIERLVVREIDRPAKECPPDSS